jgi:ABC-type transport system involved in cytochrome c biogenesis permease subunit
MICYLVSFFLIGISWMIKPLLFRKISLSSMALGFLLHTYGIIMRMIIMQRPPVSTLYESILFVGFILVLFALIFEFFRKDTLGILVATIGGVILHFIGFKYAADGDTLGVLVAVLNSNFWLSTHVTTITTGYGVSIVAGLMAHIYLVLCIIKPKNKKMLDKVFNNTYGLTLMGLFFTMFGTILGGIWADQSWGRFWGWDPKENGALLIVLWHLMMLHLRVSGLVGHIGYAYGVCLVNIIVAIAWFGVNLLNVGLHSYGFTDNVATNLFLFIFFEIAFTSILYFFCKKKQESNLKKMKLYLVHTGYYDKSSGDGFYEQHTNIFIVAETPYDAREKVKNHQDFIDKKMHIDGIKEIENIDGYDIKVEQNENEHKINIYNHYQVRFLKSAK